MRNYTSFNQDLRKAYDQIAEDFSQKRDYLWPDQNFFLDLVKAGDKVLDLGCGSGRLYSGLKEKKVDYLGVDFSKKLIQLAKNNSLVGGSKARFLETNILANEAWVKIGRNYDVIFSFAVFHHFASPLDHKKIMLKINKALKPEGICVITVWNLWQKKFWIEHLKQLSLKKLFIPYSVSNGKDKTITVQRFHYCFTKWELRKLFENNGFRIIREKYNGNLCLAGSVGD